ncbi:MAG: cytochrome c [Acidobacteria bacterium]|nr:cytochrome c [Acidobacteriota bacterium]
MNLATLVGMTVSLGFGVVLGGGLVSWPATERSSSGQAAPNRPAPKDDFQRSAEIYDFKTTARSGAQRGEEIYYYKCWMCHNKYTKTAPLLHDLYKRPKLLSGQPVNDETVSQKIKNGGPAMPAYRYTLTDADLADLLSYFREGKCCFEADEPPRNPRYRY